jgi:hypothetical protein
MQTTQTVPESEDTASEGELYMSFMAPTAHETPAHRFTMHAVLALASHR